MIRLKCKSCQYEYEITEAEAREDMSLHKYCLICGGENEIINLDSIVHKDLETQVKENVDKWQKQYGWDYVLDLVAKCQDVYCVGRLYVAELKRRGFNIQLKECCGNCEYAEDGVCCNGAGEISTDFYCNKYMKRKIE